MNHFQVAAGILRDGDGRVLITERLGDRQFTGLWEFPGGKIGRGESAADALRRELAEELGIEILASEPFMKLWHEYPDRAVKLEFFVVKTWTGIPQGLEGQRLRWVDISALDAEMLLPADVPVVDALKKSMDPSPQNDGLR